MSQGAGSNFSRMGKTKQTARKTESLPKKPPLPPVGAAPAMEENSALALESNAAVALNAASSSSAATTEAGGSRRPDSKESTHAVRKASKADLLEAKPVMKKKKGPPPPPAKPLPSKKKVPDNFEELMYKSKQKVAGVAGTMKKMGAAEFDDDSFDDDEVYLSDDEYDNFSNLTEAPKLLAAPRAGKGKAPKRSSETVTFEGAKSLHLLDRNTFPLHQIKEVFSSVRPDNDNILDLTGCAQITDAVLSGMRDLPFNVRDSVIGVRLTGCHLVTDAGVEYLAECFHSLKKLTLAGCPKVTEASLMVVAKKCSFLETLDIAGTNVAVLPRALSDLILVTDCTPLVSPLPAEMRAFPLAPVDMTKAVVIRRHGESTLSALHLLQGDKNVAVSVPFGCLPNLACGKGVMVNVVECSQSTMDLFCHGWGMYVIPSELTDKTRIEEEAKAIFAIILSVLLKTGAGTFVLLGMHTSKAGIVPTAVVMEMVQKMAKAFAFTADMKKTFLADPESLAQQLRADQIERLKLRIKELTVTSLEVNVDETEKACTKLKEHLASQSSQNPESKTLCRTLGDMMQSFPEKTGKDLKQGIHTLSGAAKIVLQGGALKSPLEAQGAVLYLTKMGKLCSYKQASGREVYLSTAFMCQLLTTLLDPPPETRNRIKDIAISDEAVVLTMKELADRASKAKVTVELVAQVIQEVAVLGTQGVQGDLFVPYSCLPTQPDINLDRFSPASSTTQVTYLFVLPVPVPPQLWFRVLSRLNAFRWPLHLWRQGLVIQHGIVELLIACEGDRITMQGQTIDLGGAEGEVSAQCQTTLWQCIEEYKLLLDAEFVSAGFMPQVACTSDKPKPDNVTAIVEGHSMPAYTSDSRCQFCGDLPENVDALLEAEAKINPRILSSSSILFTRFDERDAGGSLKGSNVILETGGKARMFSRASKTGRQQFTILFNSGGFQELQLTLSSLSKSHTILFGADDTISLKPANQKDASEMAKPVAGVSISITVEAVEDKVHCVVDCRGEVLAQQTLPYDQYRLGIQVKEKYQQNPGQTPQLAKDRIQFTVLCSSFGYMGSSELKKGMKLEALDRLNPHLICVATIEDIQPERKGGPLLIHFDGWTSRYDFWAEEDSKDLHPLGFMAEVGHKLGGKVNPQLQAPKNYGKAFDWATYLREQNAEPVPYSFFNAVQTKGTPPDTTLNVCSALGLISGPQEKKRSFCYTLPHRHSALEHWAKQQLQQQNVSQKVATFLKVNARVFCLLPSDLDVKFLRYPSVSSLCRVEKQTLHLLCHGQDNLYHFVDHPGLKCSDVLKTFQGQETFLQCAYLLLSLSRGVTIPMGVKKLCQGVAGVIPVEQQPRLEKGFRRLYHLYLMLFRFLDLADKSNAKTSALGGETQMRLVEAMGKDAEFSSYFCHSPDMTKIRCKAHDAAMSNDKGLTAFPSEVFMLNDTVHNLHLSGNSLESLPPDLSQKLPALNQLMVSKNKLTALPSLADFRNLTHLYVSDNQLKILELTDNLSTTLEALVISNNPLDGLPSSIAKMSALTGLVADNVGTVKSLDTLCGLKNLKSASFNSCVVSALPGKFHTCPLMSLKLAAIPLVRPRSSSGMEQLTTESLMKHYEKYTAFAQLSAEARAVLFLMVPEKPEEENIAAINDRMLQRFPRLGGVNFPPQLLQMTQLVRLDLSHQGFITVPDDIKSLKNLTELLLNGCDRLESLSAQLSTLPLETLGLNDCPMLKTPPPEIVHRGFQAVYGYLRRLQMGSVVCKRTKLMMVGLGGAGKTSLVRCLRSGRFYEDYDYEEMITDGIDICEWEVPIEKDKPLQFSVWDFAGQTVYYNTHQFFMSNRAVYLLLWNIRLGYEHAGLDFWLSSIACHAPQAPVMIVGTHFDKVNKTHIPEAELKRRFPQIHGFHFVSSYTGHGIQKLKDELKAVTLTQKYMGEKIPEVWLNLEKQLGSVREEGKALLPWADVESAGHRSGIFDDLELTQAVQFLHDLGSVQFFNTEFLRSNVVIVPQWIVDVMACVVTVHEGPIKNGVLRHEDLEEVWQAYPKSLHPWLLRLTEEFDLTFSLPDQPANVIPCLLPETEPQYDWPKVNRDSGEREMKMIYKFDYLPAGLFNRAQVRLHEFSDNAILWKKGSMLRKNRHSALVLQTGTIEVLVKAQGFKPENVLFLVHEVFECLIAESYSGVHYDYFIPCMECQSTLQSEPCMFPRSKVQRAVEFKAPFLQCDSFHIMSIPEIQAIMPPDHSSDFDDHLHRSVHELHSLEEDLVISVFVCYSRKNVPSLAEDGKIVHPSTVLQDLRKAGYKVSFTDDPENANMEALTLSMKSAQVVIIGISDEFLSNKQCYSLIFYARETLKKPFLLMTLGKTSNWQKQDINFLLGNEVYVKMQDIARYDSKIKELVAAVKTKAGVKTTEVYPDCFISYCWKNSQTAVKLGTSSHPSALGWGDPRAVKDFLSSKGVSCWLDIEQMGQEGFYEDLARGVRTSKVMVAFVSDEYSLSKTCRMEFQFAVGSVRIPVIVAVVGTGYQWESSEIGMLAVGHGCPKVNLQLENPAGLDDLLTRVKDILGKTSPTSSSSVSTTTPLSTVDQRKISFQEALELTQRKLLRQLVMYKANSGTAEFPHLVVIDLVSKVTEGQGQGKDDKSGGSGDKDMQQKEEEGKEQEEKEERKEEEEGETTESDQYCFRLLCEWEQGWHTSPVSIPFPRTSADDDAFLKEVAPFCVRMMAVLKHTALPLPVLTSPQGEQLGKSFEEWSSRNSTEFKDAYHRLVDTVQKQDKQKTYGGLKRCHVTNGKQLWLCPEHSTQVGNVSADVVTATTAVTYAKRRAADDDDTDDDDDDFNIVHEEEEDLVPEVEEDASPPPVQTPRTPKSTQQRSAHKVNRASSRACLLM